MDFSLKLFVLDWRQQCEVNKSQIYVAGYLWDWVCLRLETTPLDQWLSRWNSLFEPSDRWDEDNSSGFSIVYVNVDLRVPIWKVDNSRICYEFNFLLTLLLCSMYEWRKIGPFWNRALHCPTTQGTAKVPQGSPRVPQPPSCPGTGQLLSLAFLCNILATFNHECIW